MEAPPGLVLRVQSARAGYLDLGNEYTSVLDFPAIPGEGHGQTARLRDHSGCCRHAPAKPFVRDGASGCFIMNRRRTDVLTARRLVAAALSIFLIGGWPHEVQAEPQAPPQMALAPTFSRAALDHIGQYIRNEVATGKIPGAILLIQQHGKPVYFESFGVSDPDTGRPMTADAIFQI